MQASAAIAREWLELHSRCPQSLLALVQCQPARTAIFDIEDDAGTRCVVEELTGAGGKECGDASADLIHEQMIALARNSHRLAR